MRALHGITGRLFRHVTIFYCSLPESVHQHKADITIELNAFHKYMFSSCLRLLANFMAVCNKKRNVSTYKANLLLYSVRDRAVTPRCFGRWRLDWVVLLGRRVQEMVAFIYKYFSLFTR